MASIHTAKRPRLLWTAIAAGVMTAVAAIFWTIERGGDNNESSAAVDTAAVAEGTMVGTERTPLENYLQLAAAGTPETDVDQTVIVEGLRTLAGVLGSLNLGSPELQVDLRVAAEHILLNPESTATTQSVRNGLIAAASAIETGQDDADRLRPLAEAIRLDVPLLDQQATVHTFFQESATVIQRTPPKT